MDILMVRWNENRKYISVMSLLFLKYDQTRNTGCRSFFFPCKDNNKKNLMAKIAVWVEQMEDFQGLLQFLIFGPDTDILEYRANFFSDL